MLRISKVSNARDRKAFLRLPYRIYSAYPLWVPPFKHEMNAIMKGKGSALFNNGPHEFFLAKKDGEPAGRIVVGIERAMNRKKKVDHAYFTLFESIEDDSVARALLNTAESWAKNRGMKFLKGPVSPTNGDDYRGLLVDNFSDPSAVLMPYNPAYYAGFFEGYQLYLKYLAFHYDLERVISQREIKGAEVAMERYNFSVEEADFKNLRALAKDLHKITEEAMPEWEEDIIPPTLREVHQAAKTLKLVADQRMVIIARSKDKPIGYFVAFPDFNPIIQKIRGNLFPFGWYSLLREKKSLRRVRAAILFVVPEFRKRGVPAALFVRAYNNIRNMGYKTIEGSSISWMNTVMITNARRVGGLEYKHYIVFGKNLTRRPLVVEEVYGPAAAKFNSTNGTVPKNDSKYFSAAVPYSKSTV